jgi:hypothetical protein
MHYVQGGGEGVPWYYTLRVFPSMCVCCLAFYGNTLGALFDPRIGHLTSFDLSLGNTWG